MDNRKQQDTTTSFAEVFKNSGIQVQHPYTKSLSPDVRLMVYWQGMKIYIPDDFQPETLLKLFQVLKQL